MAQRTSFLADLSRSDLFLFCLAGTLAIVLVFKNNTQLWNIGLLVVLWFLVAYPIYHLVVRDGKGSVKFFRTLYALFFVTLFVFVFGALTWPKPEEGLGTLTQFERDRFSSILKVQQEHILIHLMCPPADEKDCAVAGQFIPLFRQNGWDIKENVVERVINGSTRPGFYFVLHSTVDPDPGNKEGKTGAWTLMPNAYFSVNQAFSELIKTDLVVGASYPEKELGVYFGYGTAKHSL
jgi:hypothetical protein